MLWSDVLRPGSLPVPLLHAPQCLRSCIASTIRRSVRIEQPPPRTTTATRLLKRRAFTAASRTAERRVIYMCALNFVFRECVCFFFRGTSRHQHTHRYTSHSPYPSPVSYSAHVHCDPSRPSEGYPFPAESNSLPCVYVLLGTSSSRHGNKNTPYMYISI